MDKKKETRAEAVARLGGWDGKNEGVLELRYCRACETDVDAVDGECTKCGQPTERREQMKYRVKQCRGFWVSDLKRGDGKVDIKSVVVSSDSWDGEEDADDLRIFFYTDGAPIEEGVVLDIDDGFVLTSVEELTEGESK